MEGTYVTALPFGAGIQGAEWRKKGHVCKGASLAVSDSPAALVVHVQLAQEQVVDGGHCLQQESPLYL